jgi:hypothetical protein
MLRGAVYGTILIWLGTGDRAYVDDVATLARLNHRAADNLGDIEQTLDIGVNHSIPVARVALVDMLEASGKTRIVDKDIYTTQRLEVLDTLRLASDVEVQRHTLCATCLDLTFEGLETILTTACDNNLRILAREA